MGLIVVLVSFLIVPRFSSGLGISSLRYPLDLHCATLLLFTLFAYRGHCEFHHGLIVFIGLIVAQSAILD